MPLPITDTASAGDGSVTLVASHSFASSRGQWTDVAGLLADRYRTVAVDAPGFGDAADTTGYSVAEMAARIAETINGLDLQRYVLIGHSMTGKVMAVLASRAGADLGLARPPERLVLVAPSPLGGQVDWDDLRRSLLAQARTREVSGQVSYHDGPDVTAAAVREHPRARQHTERPDAISGSSHRAQHVTRASDRHRSAPRPAR